MQNFAARIVTGTRKYNYLTPVIKEFKWLFTLWDAVMTFKCVKGLAPGYLFRSFTLRRPEVICLVVSHTGLKFNREILEIRMSYITIMSFSHRSAHISMLSSNSVE